MKLTLKLDKGLAANLDAYVKGFGLYGGREKTAIAFIREGLVEALGNEVVRRAMLPHLPKRIRDAYPRTRKP